MSDYVGYIYCITNNVNGKQYVGQTNMTVRKRFNDHLRCGSSDEDTTSLLYRAMHKYGAEHFSVETIETVSSSSREELKSILNDREIFHIAALNTYKPNGYNMTKGGFAFAEHAVRPVVMVDVNGLVLAKYNSMYEAERQNNIPLGSVKRALAYNSHFAKGFFWYDCDDIVADIGESIGVQHRHDVTPVFQFSLSGEFICHHTSIANAELSTGLSCSHISDACSGKRLSAGGYLWSLTDVPPVYVSKQKTHKCKPVVQMTMDGSPIKTYASATEAARELNLFQTLISKCCAGLRKSTGGFRWAFC